MYSLVSAQALCVKYSCLPKSRQDNAISYCMGIPRVGVRQLPDPGRGL